MRIYTGGTFDLLHPGHLRFLRKCYVYPNTYGRNLVYVALNTDEFIAEYKGKRPVMSYAERYDMLTALPWVHKVIPNYSGADSKPTIEYVQPEVILIGSDWKEKDYYKQMDFTQEWLDERNIKLDYIPYSKGLSTTEIKKRICELV